MRLNKISSTTASKTLHSTPIQQENSAEEDAPQKLNDISYASEVSYEIIEVEPVFVPYVQDVQLGPTEQPSLTQFEQQVKRKEQNLKPLEPTRDENYFCVCKKCHSRSEKNEKCRADTMLGFPTYIWLIVITIVLATLVGLGYLIGLSMPANSSYFAKCGSSVDCNSTSGLHCSSTNSVCNCPARNTAGRCDCRRGYYWDGTKCTLLLKHGDYGCFYDYQCETARGLQCLNRTCKCPEPKSYNSSQQLCLYKFSGCYLDTNTFPTQFYSSNSNWKTRYFVDLCIQYCFSSLRKYAAVSVNGSLNVCYCRSTLPSVPLTSLACDAFCASTDTTTIYSCGSSTANDFFRAVYTIDCVTCT